MDYNLLHPKRKLIFREFLYNKSLSFSQIEKLTGLRSNELAYFLEKLEKEGILEKKVEGYSLSEQAEYYIPFFIDSQDKLSPLPVVLNACVKDNKILLVKRDKRPFKDMWGMPGGRIKIEEKVSDASLRVMKKKTFLDCGFEKVNTVLHEKVKHEKTVHAYVIFMVTLTANSEIKEKENVKWFEISDLPQDIIPSDKHLLKNYLKESYQLHEECIENSGSEITMRFI